MKNLTLLGMPHGLALHAPLPDHPAFTPTLLRAAAHLRAHAMGSEWIAHEEGGAALWWVHHQGQKVALPLQGLPDGLQAAAVIKVEQLASPEPCAFTGQLRHWLAELGTPTPVALTGDPSFGRHVIGTTRLAHPFAAFLGTDEDGSAYDLADTVLHLMHGRSGTFGYRQGACAPGLLDEHAWLPASTMQEHLLVWRRFTRSEVLAPFLPPQQAPLAALPAT